MKIIVIMGTYRKGQFLDTAVSSFLEGAQGQGAEIEKIYLIDQSIHYCDNCRSCTQATIDLPLGQCHRHDDAEELIKKIDKADALVLASPYNMGNVTAITKTFFERCAPLVYWPFGKTCPPKNRRTPNPKKFAAIFTSCTMPAFIGKIIAPNVHRILINMCKAFGFDHITHHALGLVPCSPNPRPSDRKLEKLKKVGAAWVMQYDKKCTK